MFKLINGWTKKKIMAQVKKYNNDYTSVKDDMCSYKSKSGNRCAIGCFIPDGHAALKFRGSVGDLLMSYPELKKLMPFGSKGLEIFQCAHDDVCEWTGKSSKGVHKAIKAFLNEKVK